MKLAPVRIFSCKHPLKGAVATITQHWKSTLRDSIVLEAQAPGGISFVLAFSCGQAKTIRIRYVWIDTCFLKRRKNLRPFSKISGYVNGKGA